MSNLLTTFVRTLANRRVWAYGLFWSWNIIFLAFMFLGFAPQLLPEMMRAVRAGQFPVAFLLYAVILTLIPAGVMILGLTVLRRSPGRLFALGYGLEGPLMLLLALRFFVVREMTAAVALLLTIAGLGLVTFLWQILDRRIDDRGALLAYMRLIGLTLLLITGLYAGLWIAFYAIPVAAQGGSIIAELLSNIDAIFRLWNDFTREMADGILWALFIILWVMLFLYTATLFILMPLAVPLLYLRAWWHGVRVVATRYGRSPVLVLTTGVVVICAVLFVQSNRQPQHQAFALLETPPASPAETEVLLDRQETIRAGLLNAYLAPQRYMSVAGGIGLLGQMYRWQFDLSTEQTQRIQHIYEVIARPVIYHPVESDVENERRWNNAVFQAETGRAAELYQTFFDQPIIEGEREAVVRAMRSTWSIGQARAAWQAVDDREIHLIRQEVTLTEQGDWADIELYEVYQNMTAQRQEVVYYFSLPESAVITGVWLGNSPDRHSRFTYRVSPRGAAQAVYRNEVRRRTDPALVEQIGPRQYRLRVFPIEPQRLAWDDAPFRSTATAGPPLHMWLTWRVLAADNAWPLPHLAEKRNVYWDSASVRRLNGEPMAVDADAWLPASIPATTPVQPSTHRIDFPGDESVIIQPLATNDLPQPDGDLRLAVILDRSRSMAAYEEQVKAALSRLAEIEAGGTAIDVYLTASAYRGEDPSRLALAALDPDQLIYYGGQNGAELLSQFADLHRGEAYDALFVLTDGSGYELGESAVEIPRPDAPVWMVHLGGDLPLGYDDDTLAAIQGSGGGVTGSIEAALTRSRVARRGVPHLSLPAGATADIIDGYLWLTMPTPAADAQPDRTVTVHAAHDDFAAFAARRLILAEMHRQRETLDRVETLDHLHAIALEQSIVTPYSSMIVLVNENQHRLLDQLENQADRFQREYEAVGETTGENPVTVTGVPEPEEWLLLALAAGMLAWYLHTSRRGLNQYRPG